MNQDVVDARQEFNGNWGAVKLAFSILAIGFLIGVFEAFKAFFSFVISNADWISQINWL